MDARFETAINDLCGVYSRFTETVTSILLKLPVRSKDTGKFEVNSRKVAYFFDVWGPHHPGKGASHPQTVSHGRGQAAYGAKQRS